jgi:hypothetical protein
VASRAPFFDLIRFGRALRRGSAIHEPSSLVDVVREVLAGDIADDSPLTPEMLMRRTDYRDLRTPKVALGDPAFDFELPWYDFNDGHAVATGATVRLSEFRSVQPVALIFGSYT